ncbi:MAG: hypothetical protein H7195_10775, partial [Chryseobacterium sp.]|nr:hypothetical protein [Chryseobacterium sp.]
NNRVRSTDNNGGFRTTTSQTTPERNQISDEVRRENSTRSGSNNSGGHRSTDNPQNSNRSDNFQDGRR